jgi:hypothetical protein
MGVPESEGGGANDLEIPTAFKLPMAHNKNTPKQVPGTGTKES